MKRLTLEQKMERYTRKGEGCWEWTGAINSHGYGTVRIPRGTNVGAHTIAYRLAHGDDLRGLWVLHRCDNRKCVRPDHLFLGTATDNNRDRQAKGRGNSPKGARHYAAKLTDEQVREIRRRYRRFVSALGMQTRLAAEFGVSRATIDMVARGQRWAHVG